MATDTKLCLIAFSVVFGGFILLQSMFPISLDHKTQGTIDFKKEIKTMSGNIK